jgi:hypothetical protein
MPCAGCPALDSSGARQRIWGGARAADKVTPSGTRESGASPCGPGLVHSRALKNAAIASFAGDCAGLGAWSIARMLGSSAPSPCPLGHAAAKSGYVRRSQKLGSALAGAEPAGRGMRDSVRRARGRARQAVSGASGPASPKSACFHNLSDEKGSAQRSGCAVSWTARRGGQATRRS